MPPREFDLVGALKNEDRWQKRVKLSPDKVMPAVLYGIVDENGDIQRIKSSTISRPNNYYGSGVVAAAGGNLTPGTTAGIDGTVYEILDWWMGMQAGIGVADRDLFARVNKYNDAIGGTVTMWSSQNVRVTASQYGAIWLPESRNGYYHVNDNGTVALSTVADNPVPFSVTTGDQVVMGITNVDASDLASFRVVYRRLR